MSAEERSEKKRRNNGWARWRAGRKYEKLQHKLALMTSASASDADKEKLEKEMEEARVAFEKAKEIEIKDQERADSRAAIIDSVNKSPGVRCISTKTRYFDRLRRGDPPLSIVPAEGTYEALRKATREGAWYKVDLRGNDKKGSHNQLINDFAKKLVDAAMLAWKAAKPPGSLNLKVNGFKQPPGLKKEIERQLKEAIYKEQQKLEQQRGQLTAANEPVGLSPKAIEVAKDMEDVKKDIIEVEGEVKAAKSQLEKTEKKVSKKKDEVFGKEDKTKKAELVLENSKSEVKKLEGDIAGKEKELKALKENLPKSLEIVEKAEEVERDRDIELQNLQPNNELEKAREYIRKFTEAEKELNAAKKALPALQKKEAKDKQASKVAQEKLKSAEAALKEIEQQLNKDKKSLTEKESNLTELNQELNDLQSEEKLAKTPAGQPTLTAVKRVVEPILGNIIATKEPYNPPITQLKEAAEAKAAEAAKLEEAKAAAAEAGKLGETVPIHIPRPKPSQ